MIILTNDDGIDAPGIQALEQALGRGTVVAPDRHLSGCGHQVTTNRPLRVEQRSDKAYAIDGTPADCSRIALTQLFPDRVEWVISGINAGGNLGVDVYISGTVAAVREAAILGVKAIAISHWIRRPLPLDWEVAARRTQRVLSEIMARPCPKGTYWNINLPHLEPDAPEPEIIYCSGSIAPLAVNYRREGELYLYQGEYIKRDRTPNTDVDVCFSGNIAVTQLGL